MSSNDLDKPSTEGAPSVTSSTAALVPVPPATAPPLSRQRSAQLHASLPALDAPTEKLSAAVSTPSLAQVDPPFALKTQSTSALHQGGAKEEKATVSQATYAYLLERGITLPAHYTSGSQGKLAPATALKPTAETLSAPPVSHATASITQPLSVTTRPSVEARDTYASLLEEQRRGRRSPSPGQNEARPATSPKRYVGYTSATPSRYDTFLVDKVKSPLLSAYLASSPTRSTAQPAHSPTRSAYMDVSSPTRSTYLGASSPTRSAAQRSTSPSCVLPSHHGLQVIDQHYKEQAAQYQALYQQTRHDLEEERKKSIPHSLLEKRDKEVLALQQQIATLQQEQTHLREKASDAIKQHQQDLRQHEALQRTFTKAQKAAQQEREEEREALQRQLSDAVKKQEKAQLALASDNAIHRRLEQDIVDLKRAHAEEVRQLVQNHRTDLDVFHKQHSRTHVLSPSSPATAEEYALMKENHSQLVLTYTQLQTSYQDLLERYERIRSVHQPSSNEIRQESERIRKEWEAGVRLIKDEKRQVESDLASARRQVDTLQHDLDRARAESSRLKEGHLESQRALSEAEHSVRSLKRQQTFNASLSPSRSPERQLSPTRSPDRSRPSSPIRSYEESHQLEQQLRAVERLQGEVSTLRQRAAEEAARADGLDIKLRASERKLELAEEYKTRLESLQQAPKEEASSKAQEAALLKKIDSLEQQLLMKRKTSVTLTNDIESDRIKYYEDQLKKLNDQLFTVEKQLETEKKQRVQSEKENTAFQELIRDRNKQIDRLASSRPRLASTSSTTLHTADKMTSPLFAAMQVPASLSPSLQALERSMPALVEEQQPVGLYDEAEKKQAELAAALDALKAENAALVEEMTTLRAQMVRDTIESSPMSITSADELERLYAAKVSECTELEAKLASLSTEDGAELAAAQRQIKENEATIADLRAQHQTEVDAVKQLKRLVISAATGVAKINDADKVPVLDQIDTIVKENAELHLMITTLREKADTVDRLREEKEAWQASTRALERTIWRLSQKMSPSQLQLANAGNDSQDTFSRYEEEQNVETLEEEDTPLAEEGYTLSQASPSTEDTIPRPALAKKASKHLDFSSLRQERSGAQLYAL